MPKNADPNERNIQRLAVARLRSLGQTQKAVAARLRLSQPQVSRLEHEAKSKDWRWLRGDPSLLRHAIPPDLLEEVDRMLFSPAALRKRVQSWVKGGRFCDVRVADVDSHDEFGRVAAELAEDVVMQAKTLGIMWGRAMDALVDGFAHKFSDAPRASEPVCVVPLSGEPLFIRDLSVLKYSSSLLAGRLEKLLNGMNRDDAVSLSGVPAYIPTDFNGDEARGVRKFIGKIPGYQKVFGEGADGDGSLIDDVDTVLTGIGVFEQGPQGEQHGVFLHERLAGDSLTGPALKRLVHGDIGGVLIRRSGLNKTESKRVDAMNHGWVGLQEDHLRRCAKHGRKNGARGVVVVAEGASKAELIREIVTLGLANVLIVDRPLGNRLERLS